MKISKLFLLLLPSVLFLGSCADPIKEVVYPKATHLYFTDYTGRQVGVMDINVPNTYNVIADASDGLDTLAGLTIDFKAGKIYVTEETKNRILRINLDGSGAPEVLFDVADTVNTPTAVAIDPTTNTLYWANSGTGHIKKGTMDGANAKSIFEKTKVYITYCYGMAVSSKSNRLYFSDLGDQAAIWIGQLSGTGARGALYVPSDLTLQNPSGIFLDEQTNLMYWADEGLGKILVGDVRGGAASVLYDREDGITRPDGIAVDRGNGKIYWTETAAGSHKIVRANLDGTGTPETILEGIESYSIVLRFDNQ